MINRTYTKTMIRSSHEEGTETSENHHITSQTKKHTNTENDLAKTLSERGTEELRTQPFE